MVHEYFSAQKRSGLSSKYPGGKTEVRAGEELEQVFSALLPSYRVFGEPEERRGEGREGEERFGVLYLDS